MRCFEFFDAVVYFFYTPNFRWISNWDYGKRVCSPLQDFSETKHSSKQTPQVERKVIKTKSVKIIYSLCCFCFGLQIMR